MPESLLSYFERELVFLRHTASDFARLHPKAARNLDISVGSIEDPDLIRLTESVALLNARLQQRLDDRYPELVHQLLQLLFPHFLRPVPAWIMMVCEPDEDLGAPQKIPCHSTFEALTRNNERCLFRTCREQTVYPFQIKYAEAQLAPFDCQRPIGAEEARAAIILTIEANDPDINLNELGLDSLDVHLCGEGKFVLQLYDALIHGLQQITVTLGDVVNRLPPDRLYGAGFEGECDLLPYNGKTFAGFRLLSELFLYQEKFNTITLDCSNITGSGPVMEIALFLDDLPANIVRLLSQDNFRLFCIPAINLFPVTSEPINIDHKCRRYPVMMTRASADGESVKYDGNAVGKDGLEVFSIERMLDVTGGKSRCVPPLFGENYRPTESSMRWCLHQTQRDDGTLFTTVSVAEMGNESLRRESVWIAETLCSNGRRVNQLPPAVPLTSLDTLSLSGTVRLLHRPHVPVRNFDRKEAPWQLLAHLHFNFNALFEAENPPAALRSLLSLYNFGASRKNQFYIDAIIGLEARQVVEPFRFNRKSCLVTGTRILITLNVRPVDGGICLLAGFLDRFFSGFAGFNSFTQVVIQLEGMEQHYQVFPKRAGCKVMI